MFVRFKSAFSLPEGEGRTRVYPAGWCGHIDDELAELAGDAGALVSEAAAAIIVDGTIDAAGPKGTEGGADEDGHADKGGAKGETDKPASGKPAADETKARA